MVATTTTIRGVTSAATRTPEPGMTDGAVRTWLRLEGVAAFGAGLALFGASGGNWLFLVPLILLPDLSIAGFLAGPRVGTFTYNAFHNWALGIVVLGLGAWLASPAILIAAAILVAHVGMDRAAGYGLKLPGSFQATHLGRMGRTKA
jgi:uncharacterized protein DUF4260